MKNLVCLLVCVPALAASNAVTGSSARPGNFFTNPSFENSCFVMCSADQDDWHLDKAGATEASFAVNKADAAAGDRSACVTIGRVAEWGTQFGQAVDAGQQGKTYTFAVLVKAVQQPVKVWLQIERRAKPYDRAAESEPVVVKKDGWTELHATFKVEKDFAQGWFAYISCEQSNCAYRADLFRLYEGDYVPYREVSKEAEAASNVHVFDTGAASAMVLTAEAVGQRNGWKEIAAGKKPAGDLYVANANLALVFRKQTQSAECFYRLGAQWVAGPQLVSTAVGGERAQKTDALRVIESAPAKAVVEVGTTTAAGHAILTRYVVRRNQALLEVQPGKGMGSLAVEAPSRYAVLPDIFGGDLLIDAAHAPADKLRLPNERVVAQLLAGGNAILACAWRSDAQKLKLNVSGSGAERMITSTEIQCNPEKNLGVWLSVLAAPGIWYQQPIAALDAVKDLQADWKVPFRALWRADYQRTDGLIDSWRCVIKKPNNEYEGFGVSVRKKARTVWSSTRGTYAYPVCVDGERVCLRNT
ncbi:MAG: carbohydrate binding domain-containing protein, partial [Kiritimatiellaeota bacterium]|nr:carbohydrate binding domain-containing protein [Kiritimatiellota bacterium]